MSIVASAHAWAGHRAEHGSGCDAREVTKGVSHEVSDE
jgi:hypothetical protein